MKDIQRYDVQIFEDIKHINEYGQEFWHARELQPVLEYSEWRNFEKVISKAKIACKNAGGIENNDFVDVNKMVQIPEKPPFYRRLLRSRSRLQVF